jgi:hypothetical protein
MLFFAGLCKSFTTYQPIIIKNIYISIVINKKKWADWDSNIWTTGLKHHLPVNRVTRKKKKV